MKILKRLQSLWMGDFNRWILWFPVGVALGIFAFFSLRQDPSLVVSLTLGGSVGVGAFLLLRSYQEPVLWVGGALVSFGLGFCAAQLRTWYACPPLIQKKTAPLWVEGRVEGVEYPVTSKNYLYQRVILGNLSMDSCRKNTFKDDPPPLKKVRLILRKSPFIEVGERIRVKAILLPHALPAHPWAIDWNKFLCFQGVGASGFSLTQPERLGKIPYGLYNLWGIKNLRQSLILHLQSSLPQPEGALASALIAGEKTSIPPSIRDTFSRSGIAHLLAISGLHISIVIGFFAFFFHKTLLLTLGSRLTFPPLYLAYGLSLIPGFFYLCLSGMGYPTMRAFAMLLFYVMGVLCRRRVVVLRSVLAVGTIFLLIFPESLFHVSFLLSFVAVISLGALHEIASPPKKEVQLWEQETLILPPPSKSRLLKLGHFLKGMILPSLFISLATDPFILFFFQQLSFRGVFINLIAIPFTTFIILPLCILVCILFWIHGGGAWVLNTLGWSLRSLMAIGQWGDCLPYTFFKVPKGQVIFFGLCIGGWLWVCLWQRRWRFMGGPVFFLGYMGLVLKKQPLPTLWYDSSTHMIGLLDQQQKRFLFSKKKHKDHFVKKQWLQTAGLTNGEIFPYQPVIQKASMEMDSLILEQMPTTYGPFDQADLPPDPVPLKLSDGPQLHPFSPSKHFVCSSSQDCYTLLPNGTKLWIVQSLHGISLAKKEDTVVDLWSPKKPAAKELKRYYRQKKSRELQGGASPSQEASRSPLLESPWESYRRLKDYQKERVIFMQGFLGSEKYWWKGNLSHRGGGVFWIDKKSHLVFQPQTKQGNRPWLRYHSKLTFQKNPNGLEAHLQKSPSKN